MVSCPRSVSPLDQVLASLSPSIRLSLALSGSVLQKVNTDGWKQQVCAPQSTSPKALHGLVLSLYGCSTQLRSSPGSISQSRHAQQHVHVVWFPHTICPYREKFWSLLFLFARYPGRFGSHLLDLYCTLLRNTHLMILSNCMLSHLLLLPEWVRDFHRACSTCSQQGSERRDAHAAGSTPD